MTLPRWIFILANMAIFGGYLFTATSIAPHFNLAKARTRLAGIWFFFTCGLTHLEMAIHTANDEGLPLAEMTSWHMLFIHTTQAVAVWFFVIGLWEEFVRDRRVHER